MANFSTDTDLTFYQPDILTFGIANFTSPNDYHAQARADIPWLQNTTNYMFGRAAQSFFALNIPSALKNSFGVFQK